MKAAIFSNHSPRVGFGVDRKMDVSRSQVMVVAASRNHLYRRRLQVVIDAGPRNQITKKPLFRNEEGFFVLAKPSWSMISPRNDYFTGSAIGRSLVRTKMLTTFVGTVPTFLVS